jgi:hypothetical protein
MEITSRTNTRVPKTLLILAFLMLMGLSGATAKADPLLFSNVAAFQNNDTTLVDLFSNPGTTLYGSILTFNVDITGILQAGAGDTLVITYSELGSLPSVQTFQIPLFGSVSPPFTLQFMFVSPGANFQGVPATLTLNLLNSSPDFIIPSGPNQGQRVDSYTYAFNVAQPVPEPVTLFALGGGLAALAVRLRRRD